MVELGDGFSKRARIVLEDEIFVASELIENLNGIFFFEI